MMDQMNQVYDVDYSETSKRMEETIGERIHWIIQNIIGNEVLDVGCSQGVVSILLGKNGKKVTGLDESTYAIKKANNYLAYQATNVQENVTFKKADFLLYPFEDQFDTIILGEILEHITYIETFLKKAESITKENGRIIVITPFGFSPLLNQKRTFYLLDFLKMQNRELVIDKIKFFGKWVGVIFKKVTDRTENGLVIDESLLKRFEKCIYKMEENYTEQCKVLKGRLYDYKDKLQQYEVSNAKWKRFDKNNFVSKEKYLEEKAAKIQVQKELIAAYGQTELLLKQQLNQQRKNKKKLTLYQRFKKTKLGRMAAKLKKMLWKKKE